MANFLRMVRVTSCPRCVCCSTFLLIFERWSWKKESIASFNIASACFQKFRRGDNEDTRIVLATGICKLIENLPEKIVASLGRHRQGT